MNVSPSWLTARKRLGSSSSRRTRIGGLVTLVDELVDPAPPDADQGDLCGDEERLQERQEDDEQELGDR